MPGTIQVSVLEIMAFQSSSSSLSQMSIKVSMGKKEYQTKDKGDFSFPLNNVRDKLIVTLEDAEGKEVSHTVIETRLVMEKGNWNDIFHLEGGGRVRMNLQFVLTEEDRHRIRVLRESALRKKHGELLKSEGVNVATSFQPNHEISDSQKSLVESEKIQAGLRSSTPSSTVFKNEISEPQDKDTTHSIEEQKKPNITDKLEDTSSSTPMSRRFDVHLDRGRHSGSIQNSPMQIPAQRKEDGTDELKKQSPIERTPSKIKNMISVFESSLTQVPDRVEKAIYTSESQQAPSKIRKLETVSSSSSAHLDDVNVENVDRAQVPERIEKAIHTSESQKAPSKIRKLVTEIGIQNKGTTTDFNTKGKVMHNDKVEEEKTSSVSGRMLNEKGKSPPSNVTGKRKLSSDKLLKQKSWKEIHPIELQHINNRDQEPSAEKPYSSESNGAWIFPDEGTRLCITAGGKQIMDLMGGFISETKNQIEKFSSPASETAEQVKEEAETSQRYQDTKTEDSADAETQRGPVEKVMRVVIMVGFAALVLFTGQRKPR
ncbi:uncharacterized protein LOC126667527 isoform X2 [Mercurialis annua]|uniref:uncharacterized protein LOC126667527 isoform X2 n=1 Tax=Mercurialis annua TaxID=3986 RepID=UPI00215FAEC4|nr:uncharacterized protein LOC126667527 isoform X2 [Mercurialis annua]